jgi:hypothetical protein
MVPELITHVVVTVFTDIVEVLSTLMLHQLSFSIEFVRYVYLLHVCTSFCQLWGLSHTQLLHWRTFCELTALFKCAKSEFGSTVPKNMALY